MALVQNGVKHYGYTVRAHDIRIECKISISDRAFPNDYACFNKRNIPHIKKCKTATQTVNISEHSKLFHNPQKSNSKIKTRQTFDQAVHNALVFDSV